MEIKSRKPKARHRGGNDYEKRVVCAALVSIMTMSLAACSGEAVSAPAETKAESTEAKQRQQRPQKKPLKQKEKQR